MRTVRVMAMSRVKARSAGCTCAHLIVTGQKHDGGGKTANTSKTNRELLQLALGTVLKKRRKKKLNIYKLTCLLAEQKFLKV